MPNTVRIGSLKRRAALALLVGGAAGLLASFVLSIESIVLAAQADAQLSCDINAVLSCGAVARHWSASLLGFPNSFIGLAALPVVVTIGVSLLAGVKFPRWFMRALSAGALAGVAFAGWLFYMSVTVIQALCPWCLLLDVGMLLLCYGALRYQLLATPRLAGMAHRGYDSLVLCLLLVGLAMTVLVQYGGTLFG